ncbi:hypothetical protein COLO4_28342 [Corchorus olitorius]|uniref:Retrovirus-related Pol polyprotein from transposon TNT 1-94-like beta-barrel domain-containing protein n=1 Tax=Corchorus olitorius TaxID=93759 RepID=A0A1R3HLR2_9ROSI|nr:hypothetical protein COLO4_28342 [Corchorus olitorius]
MPEHLRVMSLMIRNIIGAGVDFSDEQQVLTMIRSLPNPEWSQMKLLMTHSKNIKTFNDMSRHLELEAEGLETSKVVALVGLAGKQGASKKKPKHKWVKIHASPKSIYTFVCAHVLVAQLFPDWIVDTCANEHVVRDRDGFVDYPPVLASTQYVILGNETREDVLEMGSYQLRMSSGRMLLLHDILYAPEIR